MEENRLAVFVLIKNWIQEKKTSKQYVTCQLRVGVGVDNFKLA
jgi:hypothetical protein